MATRAVRNRKPKWKGGISVNEFADHFADIINAMERGEVQGIAMAVVTADRPNSNEFATMSSTLVRGGAAALMLRDATMGLGTECNDEFSDWMEEACRKKRSAATETVQ